MDYAALAKKYGGTTVGSTTPVAPAPSAAPDVASIAAKYGGQPVAAPAAPAPKTEHQNMLMSLAKGIFGAPATLIARPFQAVAGLSGVSNEDIDTATKKIPILGDLIAPTPKSFADIPAEVGRGAETVALGLTPIAGGALFGAGASVEQGNDLLSTETAFNTVLGAAGGKILGLVGKPLLNAAGKVVGTITPQILKDVAAGGAKSIQDFAANHQLLGGVAGPASQALKQGAKTVDDVIEGGVGKVFGGVKNVAQSQYPNASPVKHYTEVNERDIIRPTTVNEPKYAKATAVYNEAKSRGIDLEKAATARGIQHDQIAESGKYNTSDVVDNIREGNFKLSSDLARPAIKAAEPGVPLVPISRVREAMIDKVKSIPGSQLKADAREKMITSIEKRYADSSAEARANPDGYSLTSLHDNRISSANNGKYKVGQSPSAELNAQLSREEGRVFADIFDKTVPPEVGMQPFRKELEKNFLLADYLEQLHSKKVPAGITKKAVRLFGRAVTATVGGKIGGFPGSILGAQYGDMLFSSFEVLPNPIKTAVLNKAFENRATSPVFDALRKYIGEQETAKLLRRALPAAGGSGYKEAPPTLFTTPKGKTTPIKGEAFDVANVETGKAKVPKTDRRLSSYLKKVDQAQLDESYPRDLPTIKVGPKKKSPKRLNDIL